MLALRALNVVASVEVVRRIAEAGEPPVTVRLVNWADEGARFGRSLFGSSAASATMDDQDEIRRRRDADGVLWPDAMAENGVDLDRVLEARKQLENTAAYLELHIEQGPVLEGMDLPLGVVLGTFGRRAQPDHLSRAGSPCRLDAHGQAPRRPRGGRQARTRDPRDRQAHGRRRRLHDGQLRDEARHRHVGGGDVHGASRPAPSRSRRCSPR